MRLSLPATVLATAILAVPASAAASTRVTDHLTAGNQLVHNLDLTAHWPDQGLINKYDSDDANTGITWGTDEVPGGWTSDTRCARFVDELLMHAYPSWATKTWFQSQFANSATPDTAKWVAAFTASSNPTHIDEVSTVAALLPGDIVLIDRTGTDPDHTAVVSEVTTLLNGKTPQPDTVQYAVKVVDSTSEPHGANINGTTGSWKAWADSRRSDNTDGTVTEYNGAGNGWMVLYANSLDNGKVYGWRWGVNESQLNKISDGHKIVFARVTDEA